MMYDSTTRINAAIAYCFLGPLFLFAKKGTPLAHPFVKSHAKKASISMGIAIIAFLLFFQLKSLLQINILGFFLYDILLTIGITLFIGTHLLAGYQAYNGKETKQIFSFKENLAEFEMQTNAYTMEQKVQILFSFLPFLGTAMYQRNPREEILTGRKVANFFVFLILLTSILLNSSINIITFVILISYIAIFTSTTVLLLEKSQFLSFKAYNFIPTYHQIEAGIQAGIVTFFQSFQVAFGKEKPLNFKENYTTILERYSKIIPPKEPFWMHPMIIALPFLNIITLPALFQKKYREYFGNILEGIFLTTLIALSLFFRLNNIIAFLIFPFVALVSLASSNTNIRAPITSIIRNFFVFVGRTKTQISDLKNNTNEQSYTFENNTNSLKNPPKQPKIDNISEKISEKKYTQK